MFTAVVRDSGDRIVHDLVAELRQQYFLEQIHEKSDVRGNRDDVCHAAIASIIQRDSGTSVRLTSRLIFLSLLAVVPVTIGTATQARMPVCAIDMGSNTFRRIVGSFEKGRYEQHSFEKQTLGVGDDVARLGGISDSKLAEIEAVLSRFKTSCDKEGAASPVAVGTSAFRDASNGHRAVEIAARLGIAMEIATERRESELAYLVGSLGQDGYAVIDAGSRSIELVARDDRSLRFVVFNLGYRVAYETFFATAENPERAALAFRNGLRQEASKAPFMKGKKKLVGVEFGDMTNALFEPAPLEGRVFSLQALKQRLQQITTLRSDEFQALKRKADIDRALPRLVVAVSLTEAFGYSQLELTERELGSGLIISAGLKPQ